ncbi:MAG: hypothetical protein HY594_01080 [Candidatus Omnitrophica bacterium]|nr:hypothetical protein [Candidatus Omnitrophota bacterium]
MLEYRVPQRQTKPLNFNQLKTYSVKSRPSKVRIEELAKPLAPGASFQEFLDSLPQILAAQELRVLIDAIVAAHKQKRPIIAMLGAHVVKCGLTPLLNDLIRRKVITAIAMNGAGIIHDFELAFIGQTSEDVGTGLEDGSFGMARETAEYLNGAAKEGARRGRGLGESVGRMIAQSKWPYRNLSLLATAYKNDCAATIHVAIGTDIIHQHPACDGAALGKTSLIDFRKFTQAVANLEGGVALNLGSAVILPEVFLKAVSVARNLGAPVKNFTAANLDMLRHYRPITNVLTRPLSLGGRAIQITGHHELLVPLIHAGVIEKLKR